MNEADQEQLNADYLLVAKLAMKIRAREADARIELRATLEAIKRGEGMDYYGQLESMFGPGCRQAVQLAYNEKMPTPKPPHQTVEFTRRWLLSARDWRDYYNCLQAVGMPMIKKVLPSLTPSKRCRFERYQRFINSRSRQQILALLADPDSGPLGEQD